MDNAHYTVDNLSKVANFAAYLHFMLQRQCMQLAVANIKASCLHAGALLCSLQKTLSERYDEYSFVSLFKISALLAAWNKIGARPRHGTRKIHIHPFSQKIDSSCKIFHS